MGKLLSRIVFVLALALLICQLPGEVWAVESGSRFRENADTMIQEHEAITNKPPYRIVGVNNPNVAGIYIFYSYSEIIGPGTTIYVYTKKATGGYTTETFLLTEVQKSSIGNGFYPLTMINGQVRGTYGLKYVIVDRSTAQFHNQYDSDVIDIFGYDPLVEADMPDADITELLALIAQAEAIEDIGYTIVSWSRLQTALASSKSLVASTYYTQAQVDSSAQSLRSAINSLEAVSTPDPGPGPEPGDHRYLIDGFRVSDLSLVVDPVLQNISAARHYLIYIIAGFLAVMVLRKIIYRLLGRRW